MLLQGTHLTAHVIDVATQLKEDLIEDLTLVLETVIATFTVNRGQLGGLLIQRYEAAEHLGRDMALWGEHGDLLSNVLQLAHVAWPLIAHEDLLGFLIEHDTVHLVFLCHLHGEETEQQHDVLATLTQRGHLDGDGVQAVVEILAETPLADSLTDILVRSGHDANVGLVDLSASHRDVFARLQHAQQPGLRSQRQLTHLIEEEGALVGHTEIAWRVIDGSGI